MTTWLPPVLEAIVVLGAIFLGVRMGGIGLGLWGVAGTAILVFVFQMDPGDPPVDAFFIIIAVITASAAMQAAGGIDYLVSIASKIIQANPTRITFVAPLVAFVFTVGAGTSNIYFALIPVINETAYRNGIRPERPLAASTVTSGLGITASPVSAAMAAYLTLLPSGFTLPKILAITIPASIVACIATSIVQQRIGRELHEDPEYIRRVEAGEVDVPEKVLATLPAPTQQKALAAAADKASREAAAAGGTAVAVQDRPAPPAGSDPTEIVVTKAGRTSAYIFLAGVVIIVIMGLFTSLRPTVGSGADAAPLSMTIVIELVMFTVALIIVLVTHIQANSIMQQPLLSAGFVAAIALFGIAWMADTFISGNPQIIEWMGSVVKVHPLFLAVAIFIVAGLTTSQSATTRTLIPIALAAGMSPAIITAMWPSLIGVWLFPANGSQIAAVSIDKTGSTKLSQVPVWHSFTIPMLVSWVFVVGAGFIMAIFVH
jgi:anaerobic C4-dicarboxylate transporter DcuA